MFYSTGVTNELVRMLELSDMTPPGLPGLKPSSNSVLPVAWITRPATDLRLPFYYYPKVQIISIFIKMYLKIFSKARMIVYIQRSYFHAIAS